MSGIQIQNPALRQIDSDAEMAGGAPHTPGVISDAELGALSEDQVTRLQEINAQSSISGSDQAFLTELGESLRAQANELDRPAAPTEATLAGRLGNSGVLTRRPGLVGRGWQGLRDFVNWIFQRGDRIDSWLMDGDRIRATDDRAVQEAASEMLAGLNQEQRQQIMQDGFVDVLEAELGNTEGYTDLNRPNVRDDAVSLHEALRSQIRADAEAEARAEAEAQAARAAAVAGAAQASGARPLAEIPHDILRHPLYTASSNAFQIWFQNGWGTIETDGERRDILELVGGRPGDNQVPLLEQFRHSAALVEQARARDGSQFTSFEAFFREMQDILGVTVDGKFGGESWGGQQDWRDANGRPRASLIEILEFERARS